MATTKITIERTKEWVQNQRLLLGENVPERIDLDVDVSALSVDARKMLLTQSWERQYMAQITSFRYNSLYEWDGSASGYCFPVVNSYSPTVEQINAALLEMDDKLSGKREDWRRQLAEWKAKEEADRAEKVAKAKAITDARELLKGKIATKQAKYDRVDQARDLLAGFLAFIPQDAKRGALKAMAADSASVDIDLLRRSIEDANPYSDAVFADEDEE